MSGSQGSKLKKEASAPWFRLTWILILCRTLRLVDLRRDLVADVPQIFVEPAFHSLLQDFHGRSHGAHDPASDDSFAELEMVETEELHAFVEVEQALGNIVQAEKFLVAAIEVADGEAGALQLIVKSMAEARADVQQREETGRIEAAAMPKAGANDVIVVGRDRLQNVQQSDRVGSSNWMARRIRRRALP